MSVSFPFLFGYCFKDEYLNKALLGLFPTVCFSDQVGFERGLILHRIYSGGSKQWKEIVRYGFLAGSIILHWCIRVSSECHEIVYE